MYTFDISRPKTEAAVDPDIIFANKDDIYVYPELQKLKAKLNSVKNEIEKVNIREYEKFVGGIYPYKKLKAMVAARLSDDMYKKMVSKAFLKIHELMIFLHEYLSSLPQGGHLLTFSIAEAPGAFVPSIETFLNRFNLNWEWYAESYIDIYTPKKKAERHERKKGGNVDASPLGDHFGFIAKTRRHWIQTGDCDGDITSPANLLAFYHFFLSPQRVELGESLIIPVGIKSIGGNVRRRPVKVKPEERRVTRINPSMQTEVTITKSAGRAPARGIKVRPGLCDLVTSDVKMVPADNDYSEEENQNYAVHLGHVIAALLLCKPGGNAILKQFTYFESSSVAMLYILAQSFEKVFITKPATSTHTNSETYVVCLGLREQDREKINALLAALDDIRFHSGFYGAILPKAAIPEDFVEKITKCMTELVERQTVALEATMNLFKDHDEEKLAKVGIMQEKLAKEWLEEHL